MTSSDTTKPHIAIITCPVFVDGLRSVLTGDDNASLRVLKSGDHNRKRLLTEGLADALRASGQGAERAIVMIGAECDSDVNVGTLAREAGAMIPEEKNCIEMLLGPEKRRELVHFLVEPVGTERRPHP